MSIKRKDTSGTKSCYTRHKSFTTAHASLKFALYIAKENAWMKFWDAALEHGPDGTRSSLSLLKLLSLTVFSDGICPASNCSYIVPEKSSLCGHFLQCHADISSEITPDYLTNSIISITTDSEQFLNILPLGLSIVKCFPFYLLDHLLYTFLL